MTSIKHKFNKMPVVTCSKGRVGQPLVLVASAKSP